MRYWVPQLRLGIHCPPETTFINRFGGLPWGLPIEKYPTCRGCGRPLRLLLQLRHDPLRLNLGREGRALFAFQCDEVTCHLFGTGAKEGGDLAIVLESSELVDGLPIPPPALTRWFVPVHVIGWDERKELVTPEEHDLILHGELSQFDLPDNKSESIREHEKLGGTPSWGQPGPPFKRGDGWKFLLQMDDGVQVVGRLPTADEIGCPVTDYTQPNGPSESTTIYPRHQTSASTGLLLTECNGDQSKYDISIGNFGQGHGYVFGRNLQSTRPEVMFDWQR